MITVQVFILFVTRLLAKRKVKFSSRIKWLSIFDLVLMQNTLDPLYLAAWVVWCFFWDVFDRKYFATAGFMAFAVTCMRVLWALNELQYIYFVCAFTSCCLSYASFYNFFELG